MDLDHDTSTKSTKTSKSQQSTYFTKVVEQEEKLGNRKNPSKNGPSMKKKMQDPGTQKGIAGWRKPDKLAKATIYHKNNWEMPRAGKEWHLGC